MSIDIQNFQIDNYYIRQTSINFNGQLYLHSINDAPSLIISPNPINDDLYLQSAEFLSDENADLNLLMVWTKLGVIHRDHNYALFIADSGSNISFFRYWIEEGRLRLPKQGFACEQIYYSYSGHPIDCQIWAICDEVIQLNYEMNSQDSHNLIKNSQLIYLIDHFSLKIHRADGPAVISICRDPEERAEQIQEPLNGNYDRYGGPFPINEYYLNGRRVNSAQIKHNL